MSTCSINLPSRTRTYALLITQEEHAEKPQPNWMGTHLSGHPVGTKHKTSNKHE
jgi:hypothetical protein